MIIGGFGAPNLGKIGRMQENEDGTKSFKPFSLDAKNHGGLVVCLVHIKTTTNQHNKRNN